MSKMCEIEATMIRSIFFKYSSFTVSPSFVYAVERPFYSVSFLGASSLKTLSAA